jgi:hypothetical protein
VLSKLKIQTSAAYKEYSKTRSINESSAMDETVDTATAKVRMLMLKRDDNFVFNKIVAAQHCPSFVNYKISKQQQANES